MCAETGAGANSNLANLAINGMNHSTGPASACKRPPNPCQRALPPLLVEI